MENSRQCFVAFPNTSNFVKNTPLRVVFSTFFSVFGHVMKHCLSCLIYYFKTIPYENEFDLHENENEHASRTHFHMKGFAAGFVSKRKQKDSKAAVNFTLITGHNYLYRYKILKFGWVMDNFRLMKNVSFTKEINITIVIGTLSVSCSLCVTTILLIFTYQCLIIHQTFFSRAIGLSTSRDTGKTGEYPGDIPQVIYPSF